MEQKPFKGDDLLLKCKLRCTDILIHFVEQLVSQRWSHSDNVLSRDNPYDRSDSDLI